MNPLISIVIPAYNAERSLGRAIESCLNQSIVDLEIIVVDDCSSDRTGSIADSYAVLNPGIVFSVHNLENKQCLESRRVGLSNAHAAYVAFLDADDELSSDYCKDAYSLARGGADIVVSPIRLHYSSSQLPDEQTRRAQETMYSSPDCELSGVEILERSFLDSDQEGSIVWSIVGKLFARDLMVRAFDSIPSVKIFQAEDAYLYFIAASQARKLASNSNLSPYIYRMGIGGTHTGHLLDIAGFKSVCKGSLVATNIKNYLKETGRVEELRAEYEKLRRRLLLDPANRFPSMIKPGDGPQAFDAFLDAWPADEAVAGLATLHWHDAYEVIWAAVGSKSLQPKIRKAEVIGAYCHTLSRDNEGDTIRRLCSLWLAMGYTVVLIVDDNGELFDVPDGVKVERIPDCFECVGDAYLVRAKMLHRVLFRDGIDTLVYHQWLAEALPWDLMVARTLGVRCVVHTHKFFFTPYVQKTSNLIDYSLGYGLADAVICPGELDEEWWHQFVSRAYVEPVQLLPAHLATNPRASTGKTVAWCGNWAEEDGALDAIYAFRELITHEPRARLNVYGYSEGESACALKKIACDLGIGDKIGYCGPKKPDELIDAYRDVDIFLFSSHFEGQPIAFAEAKAAGLPCVAYELPCLSLCQPGTGVLTTNMGNADDLGRQLARVISDNSLRICLSKEALAQAHSIAAFNHVALWGDVFSELEKQPRVEHELTLPSSKLMWRCLFDQMRMRTESEKRLEDNVNQLNEEVAHASSQLSQSQALLAQSRLEAADARDELEKTKKELYDTRSDLTHVLESVSFRVGRGLTAPLRTIRDLGRKK